MASMAFDMTASYALESVIGAGIQGIREVKAANNAAKAVKAAEGVIGSADEAAETTDSAQTAARGALAEGAGDNLKMSEKQFGKKVGKHAEDFGLDPGSSESRDFVRNKANEIFREPTEIREGIFRGQGVVLPMGQMPRVRLGFISRVEMLF